MPITALPTPAPSTSDPSTFDARADALFGALPTMITEANVLQADVNSKQVIASAAAVAAAASELNAEAAADAAASSASAVKWVSGTAYVIGNVVWSPVNYRPYRRKTNGAGTTDPSVDTTNWAWIEVGYMMGTDCTNLVEDLSYLPPVTFTWNPGSLADGAGETSAAVPYPGATLGGVAVQAIAPYDLQGITCNAYCAAANSCKVRLQNESGGTIDLASGTWTLQARRI